MITGLVENQCFTKRVTKVLNVLKKSSVWRNYFGEGGMVKSLFHCSTVPLFHFPEVTG
jgi:hypothetical protein